MNRSLFHLFTSDRSPRPSHHEPRPRGARDIDLEATRIRRGAPRLPTTAVPLHHS